MALFRKRDADGTPDFMSFAGQPYPWLMDLALWASLLRKGNAAFLATPMSQVRLHAAHETRAPASPEQRAHDFDELRRAWVRDVGEVPAKLVPIPCEFL